MQSIAPMVHEDNVTEYQNGVGEPRDHASVAVVGAGPAGLMLASVHQITKSSAFTVNLV